MGVAIEALFWIVGGLLGAAGFVLGAALIVLLMRFVLAVFLASIAGLATTGFVYVFIAMMTTGTWLTPSVDSALYIACAFGAVVWVSSFVSVMRA